MRIIIPVLLIPVALAVVIQTRPPSTIGDDQPLP